MSIISKQTGYSNDSNLLYAILKEVDDICKALGPTPTTTTTANPYKTITLDWATDASASNWLGQNGAGTDTTDVNNWNIAFNLPTLGTPFTSVAVIANSRIILSNPGIINTTPYRLFSPLGSGYSNDLISIVDEGVLLHIGDSCFSNNEGLASASFAEVVQIEAESAFDNCINLTTVIIPKLALTNFGAFEYCYALRSVNFPLLTYIANELFFKAGLTSINAPLADYIGDYAFQQTGISVANFPNANYVGAYAFNSCPLDTIDLSSCTDLGGSTGNDNVFYGIIGRTITLTVPAALMTCNGGNPDGDIQYLQANNTVTIITV